MSKIVVSLTPLDIKIIEKHLSKFEGAKFSYLVWVDIGKEIGWEPLTACLHYFRRLENI